MKENLKCLIDLHLHFDGSLPIECIKVLSRRENIQIPDDESQLIKLVQVSSDCTDLNEYLKCFDFPLSLLQSAQNISDAMFYLLEELKSQGLMYAEIRFAPQLHTFKGLSQQQVVDAALSGLYRSTFPANLILCCMTGNSNHEQNLETLRVAEFCIARQKATASQNSNTCQNSNDCQSETFVGHGVVAIDLAGAEALFPLENNSDIFDYAATHNIPATIHVGEACGAENVRKALNFYTSRFGHGVRAAEDSLVMSEIAQKGITLELCPTSNLQTKVFSTISDFPLRIFISAGVPVTINTDNMTVSGTTIRHELELVEKAFSLSTSELRQLIENSINASFASDKLKANMRECLATSSLGAETSLGADPGLITASSLCATSHLRMTPRFNGRQ